MKLKPRSTTLHPRALCYKRYIDITQNSNAETIVKTTGDNYLWQFNTITKSFFLVDITYTPTYIYNNETYKYTDTQNNSFYYQYSAISHSWSVSTTPVANATTFAIGTIGSKYQLNKYLYVGSFDFNIKGAILGNTTQPIKGLIVPLETLTIQHFNDYINLKKDDLVVVDGRLYSVESVEVDHKHQPKDYSIYTATLNSIL